MIVVGDIVNFERLLLPSVMVTLDAAGAPKFTGKATVLPKPTLALDGSVIVPGGVMVTLAVALAIFGVVVLAVIVVEPCPTGGDRDRNGRRRDARVRRVQRERYARRRLR